MDGTIWDHFAIVRDPRIERKKKHKLKDVLASTTASKHIAIDGKTLRRSFDKASKKAAIHMVSAWVHENHAAFGQLKVDDKTNEIKAIPKLLAILTLKGATVPIDAMGCQREICRQIVDKEGHYVLALKGNQGHVLEVVEIFMKDAIGQVRSD